MWQSLWYFICWTSVHPLKDYCGSASIKYFKIVVWSCTDHYNYNGKYKYGKRLSCQENKDFIGYTIGIWLKIQTAWMVEIKSWSCLELWFPQGKYSNICSDLMQIGGRNSNLWIHSQYLYLVFLTTFAPYFNFHDSEAVSFHSFFGALYSDPVIIWWLSNTAKELSGFISVQ